MSLYTVDGVAPDYYMHGMTSFNKDHLINNLPKGVPIKEVEVPTLSVATLLSKHSIKKIDLLQIDTEGYDFELIKMFCLDAVKPTIINFEHVAMPRQQRWECSRFLAAHGYDLASSKMDTVAFSQKTFDR